MTGATGATLNTGDILTGIGGTNTFNITGNGGTAAAVQTKNVQDVNVRAVADTEINQVLMAGVVNATSSGSLGGVSFTNGQLSTTYGLVNTNNIQDGNANLTVSYQAAAGTADKALLSINNAGGKVGTTNVTQTITTTAASGDIEAISLATTGTNRVALGGGAKVATFTVTGDGANTITIDAAATTFKLDASASTGANTLDVKTFLSTNSSVIGGSAADTLKATLNSGTQYISTITDVETLEFGVTAGGTVNAKNITGAEALKLSTITSSATFTNLSQDIDAVNVGTSSAFTATGALKLGYVTGSESDVVVTMGASPSSGSSKLSVGVAGLEVTGNAGALKVVSAGSDANNITVGDLNALTTNKSSSLEIVGDAQELTIKNSAATKYAISAPTIESLTIDASKKAVSILNDDASNLAISVDETLQTLTVTSGSGAATVEKIDLLGTTTTAAIDATFDITAGTKTATVGVISVASANNSTSASSLAATLNLESTAGSAGATDGQISVAGFAVNESTAGTSSAEVNLAADAGNVTLTALTLTSVDSTNITVSAAKDQTAKITSLVGGNANSTLTSITASGEGTIDLFRTAPTSSVVGNTVVDALSVTGNFLMDLSAAASTNNIVVDLGKALTENSVSTGAGLDVITGGAGNDRIRAGAAADIISAGAGNDTIVVAGTNEQIAGDIIDGGTGTNLISLDNSAGAVTAVFDFDNISNVLNIVVADADGALSSAEAVTVTFSAIAETTVQTVILNASVITDTDVDLIVTNDAASSTTTFSITGGAGDDVIVGSNGADTLLGGAGDDVITGGGDNDVIALGTGSDTIVFSSSAAANGLDTISTFQTGATTSGGDILNFGAFLGANATVTAKVANSAESGVFAAIAAVTNGSTTAVDTTGKVAIIKGTLSDFDTANEVAALFGTGDSLTLGGSGGKALVIVAANDGTEALVWMVDSADTSVVGSEVIQVGTMTTIADAVDSFSTANFIFA